MASEPPTLQIDFSWTAFQNRVSLKTDTTLQPLYTQHFRTLKPQLRFDSAPSNTPIATATIPSISITPSCTLHGRSLPLTPLSRWKTAYGYTSNVHSTEPVTMSWIANSSMKTWDFVCLDAAQLPVAKFSVNFWALKQVGMMYFQRVVSEEERDEIVVTGLTVLYLMASRLGNPLHLFGAAFAKTGEREKEGGEVGS
ncbi:hypothetical protein P153DRAFT_297872 [Dothidotthia symphoricarpi CBS 119687]|uniref:Uncharacterized protein n=1 Tax=Dothidotthia symphoricarpi CBS 119687 TaxID=1392245 RepID=A0A6A6A5X4_9PLEO|nr:uncharacterized protein P153DRAFT_297872 [Dothidotthia symphoricarpi CBS 119687]KAF2126575.1 hypothetical protein P153DRAFT_297872 [Dothidotthia symphoricarpi CBS 119687]